MSAPPDAFRRDATLGAIRDAQRELYRTIALALVGCIIVVLVMIYATGAHAAGWGWFRAHIRPADCGGGTPIIGSIYWHGSHNADGTRFNPHGISAAHRTLPFGTVVTLRNPKNGRTLSVPIKDRGPWIAGVHAGGAIDLSLGAARALGMTASQYLCM